MIPPQLLANRRGYSEGAAVAARLNFEIVGHPVTFDNGDYSNGLSKSGTRKRISETDRYEVQVLRLEVYLEAHLVYKGSTERTTSHLSGIQSLELEFVLV
jgi:hypothetical protein